MHALHGNGPASQGSADPQPTSAHASGSWSPPALPPGGETNLQRRIREEEEHQRALLEREDGVSSASEASSDRVERLTTRSEGGRDSWVDMLDTLFMAMSREGPCRAPQVRNYHDLSLCLEAALRRDPPARGPPP